MKRPRRIISAIAWWLHGIAKGAKDDRIEGAQRAMLNELFNDHYVNRKDIYKINFIRGIFFGLGSALGGTLAIAILVWMLALFVDFPLVGEYFRDAQNTILP